MVWLISTLGPMGYIMFAGGTFRHVYAHFHNTSRMTRGEDIFLAGVVSALWPISATAAVGHALSKPADRKGKAQRKQAAEIAQAEHRLKLAQFETRRTLELEKALER